MEIERKRNVTPTTNYFPWDDEPETTIKKAPVIRGRILDTAKQCVCTDRESQYGSPEDNFNCIARLWNAYKPSVTFSAHDVAIMMVLLKVARISTGKPKEDNYIDLAGYAACAGEIAIAREEE